MESKKWVKGERSTYVLLNRTFSFPQGWGAPDRSEGLALLVVCLSELERETQAKTVKVFALDRVTGEQE